jgi:alpha-tubulin suppressor-like RCC1 family protein
MRKLTSITLVALAAAVACGRTGLLDDGDVATGGPASSSSSGGVFDGGPEGTVDTGVDALDPDGNPQTVTFAGQSIPNVQQVVAGESHACLRDKKSRVFCWGVNAYGELGNGTTDLAFQAVRVTGLPDILRLASGQHHVCALGIDQSVWCWGADDDGELGTGLRQESFTTPQLVTMPAPPVSITAGGWHTCATDGDGRVYCWGRNTSNECGVLGAEHFLEPQLVPAFGKGVGAMTAGTWHTCAVVPPDGKIQCVGRNSDGQLGIGSDGPFETAPLPVLSVTGATFLMAGDDHTCALTKSGTMWCWGDGFLGELGNGLGQGNPSPAPVPNAVGVIHATGGLEHTCVALKDGRAQCWGKGLQGQLGNGDTPLMSTIPIYVHGISDAVQVAAGSEFSCIAHSDHGAACWGASENGELGHGKGGPEFETTPVEVLGL